MTERLFDVDSHLTEFTATVISCDERADGNFELLLDCTAFFYEGGGQASDRGYINDAKVLDVIETQDDIKHIVDKPLKIGNKVQGKIDWERRFDFMQQHSAEHILSGLANKLYSCENVGFHLSEEIVTFDFDKYLTEAQINDLERLANEKVFQNVSFNCYYPDSETLKELKYRSKKEIEGKIRIVEIENTDACACCAPHVNTSGEIGIIKLLSSERLRGGIRIELKAGRRALLDYNEKQENIHKISNLLCVKQCDTAAAVDRLLEQNNRLKFENTGLKREKIAERINNFEACEEETFLFEDGLEIKELQFFADSLYKKAGGIRGVFSPSENGFCFAICGEAQKLDAFFMNFKNEFNVKGGGRNGMVQGTVLCSDFEKIKLFLIK